MQFAFRFPWSPTRQLTRNRLTLHIRTSPKSGEGGDPEGIAGTAAGLSSAAGGGTQREGISNTIARFRCPIQPPNVCFLLLGKTDLLMDRWVLASAFGGPCAQGPQQATTTLVL